MRTSKKNRQAKRTISWKKEVVRGAHGLKKEQAVTCLFFREKDKQKIDKSTRGILRERMKGVFRHSFFVHFAYDVDISLSIFYRIITRKIDKSNMDNCRNSLSFFCVWVMKKNRQANEEMTFVVFEG